LANRTGKQKRKGGRAGTPAPQPAEATTAGRRSDARTRLSLLLPALVFCLGILAFLPTLRNGFVWDDQYVVKDNALIRDVRNIPRFFTERFGWDPSSPFPQFVFYRPLVSLSLLLDYLGGQGAPWLFHLTNVLLHALTALAVYYLGLVLLRTRTGAGVLGVVFALHPVHTEVVAFVANRCDLLAGLFSVVSVYSYLRASRTATQHRNVWRAASLVALALALLSKENALMVPLVMAAAWLLLPAAQGASTRRRRRPDWWPHLLLAVAFFLLRQAVVGYLGSGVQLAGAPLRVAATAKIFWAYVCLVLLPVWSSPRYEPSLDLGVADWLSIALWVAALWAVYRAARRTPLLAFGVAWFLLVLLPTSNVLEVSGALMAERWLYLPSVGLLLAVVSAGETVPARFWHKRIMGAAVAAVGGALALALLLLCWSRGAWWRTELSLFATMVSRVPHSAVAHANYGVALAETGDTATAIAECQRALALRPDYPCARRTLATVLLQLGRVQEAAEQARQAVQLAPEDARARAVLGIALVGSGRAQEGVVELQKAVALVPGSTDFRYNLALGLRKVGRLQEALTELRSLLELDPDFQPARTALARWPREQPTAAVSEAAQGHQQRALALARSGQREQALAEFRAAVQLDPNDALAWYNMGYLLLSGGDPAQAIPALERALALEPNLPQAHYHLAQAYLAQGRKQEARKHLEECLRLDPQGPLAKGIQNTLSQLSAQ